MIAALVALGAAVGAPLRWWLSTRLDDGDGTPWGTLGVNIAGSFVLGLLSGTAADAHTLALLGTGFCGGLTTYSAFAVQSAERGPRGTAYALVTVAASLAACGAGWWVGQA